MTRDSIAGRMASLLDEMEAAGLTFRAPLDETTGRPVVIFTDVAERRDVIGVEYVPDLRMWTAMNYT